MNIDYTLLEEQRNHLLSILWDEDEVGKISDKPVLLDAELGWGIIHLLDHLLDENIKANQRKQSFLNNE